MKVFYTGSDIEELAANGVTRLELGPGAVITDVGRETAEALGIEIVRGGQSAKAAPVGAHTPAAAAPSPSPTATPVSAKPRGCQHGPLAAAPRNSNGTAAHAEATRAPDGVVGKLANVISRMAGQGG